jgi:hypothetical protein
MQQKLRENSQEYPCNFLGREKKMELSGRQYFTENTKALKFKRKPWPFLPRGRLTNHRQAAKQRPAVP